MRTGSVVRNSGPFARLHAALSRAIRRPFANTLQLIATCRYVLLSFMLRYIVSFRVRIYRLHSADEQQRASYLAKNSRLVLATFCSGFAFPLKVCDQAAYAD